MSAPRSVPRLSTPFSSRQMSSLASVAAAHAPSTPAPPRAPTHRESDARLATVEALRSSEAELLAKLSESERELQVERAQLETLQEEVVALRRGSAAAQLSARYDEQIALQQQQAAEAAARDARWLVRAR